MIAVGRIAPQVGFFEFWDYGGVISADGYSYIGAGGCYT